VRFEWDEAKDLRNRRKHGLSFARARRLFDSDAYLDIYDSMHSDSEDRFLAIGSIDDVVVVVVYTEPEDGVIRILSARLANDREARLFLRHGARDQ